MNEINDKITIHINDLINLGKTLSIENNITILENEGHAYIK